MEVGEWPDVYTRKGFHPPPWFRVYRLLKIHEGWTVDDYFDAPGEYCDWALEFDRVEKEAQAARQETANRKARAERR